MKKLMVSLGLLLSFSASAVDVYECGVTVLNDKTDIILRTVEKAAHVAVSEDLITYRLTPKGELGECPINVRYKGYMGNVEGDCFFNIDHNNFIYQEGYLLVALNECKKTH